jgi:Phage derived protein Gp49-like (DUF891)
MEFRYACHPNRLTAEHPRIIEDLLELATSGKQEAVDAMIEMLEDFHIYGLESRFVKKLKGLPVWELKTKSRGGLKGGSRIYFFMTEEKEAVLVNAEVKAEAKVSSSKLEEVLDILEAYLDGKPVLEGRPS